MTEFKIESGIPIPAGGRGRRTGGYSKYPFREMAIGKSFFVPANGEYVEKVRNRLTSITGHYHRKTKLRFTTAVVSSGKNQGVRVWRVK